MFVIHRITSKILLRNIPNPLRTGRFVILFSDSELSFQLDIRNTPILTDKVVLSLADIQLTEISRIAYFKIECRRMHLK
jgi:hypothetical protein